MAISSCTALIDLLGQLELLAPEHLAQTVRASKAPTATPRSLARGMLQRGWLTVYQINQLMTGQGKGLVFGPYHVLDRLGNGGQSVVFKARQAEHRWLVALKVIRPDLLTQPNARRQFLLEMEAMAELNHPNIVQFCDADSVDDTSYCAMEYVEGTDLGKVVRLSGPLPLAQACDYVRQAALGLQHAHEHNLVHRDIKPVNLFLTIPAADPDAREQSAPLIKILDWGLASLRPPGTDLQEQPSSGSHGEIGTADYQSPEQARNAQAVDIRSDIYSLGCTLHFLCTGQPPFPGGTFMEKLVRHQHEESSPLHVLRPEVPAGLVAVVRRMMAKQPEARYQTPAAAALGLKPFCRLPVSGAAGSVLRPHLRQATRRGQDDTPLPNMLRSHIDGATPHSSLTSNACSPAEPDATASP
jgi:serine/threonine-protein kinase